MKLYKLKNEKGHWLADVIITNDGIFAAVSDWGNFAFAWRSFGESFEDFILTLNTGYFSSKMQSSVSCLSNQKNAPRVCDNFADRVLPALQQAIRVERTAA